MQQIPDHIPDEIMNIGIAIWGLFILIMMIITKIKDRKQPVQPDEL